MSSGHDDRCVGELYVVATPIGNLEDITLRALRVLKEADIVAAEDTRVTARLLAHHGIERRIVSLHEHNEKAMTDRVLEWLSQGKKVALVTDAGTPAVSDPGAITVKTVRAAGCRVTPVPGPSALSAALSVSGMCERRVVFCGFLPASQSARRKAIAELAREPGTLVFYEAPHRVLDCVRDLAAGLGGDRELVVARELTKLFESVHTCTLGAAAEWLAADENRTRGEFVLIVSGARHSQEPSDWQAVLAALLKELPLAQAVKLTCAATGAKRKAVYDHALELQKSKAL